MTLKKETKIVLKRHAWEEQATVCCFCAKEMFFPDFETREEFIARVENRGRLARRIFMQLRTATVDHIYKQADGGSDYHYNLRIICKFCNESREGGYPFGVKRWKDHED